MKKIVFLTPFDAEYGFSLAGARHRVIEEKGAEEHLRKTLAEPDTGLVVIDERLLRDISDDKLREMEDRWYGVLLILPAPKKTSLSTEDFAVRLITRAIGYHVRLK